MAKLKSKLAQKTTWEKAQEWEKEWHKTVAFNTLNEENKQLTYAEKLGLTFIPDDYSPYWIDGMDRSILDLGCGETSLLLKTKNLKHGYGLDPLMETYPKWVRSRYREAELIMLEGKAEDIFDYPTQDCDEVWIYNLLQHVEDPKLIIENAKKVGRIIRIFEWIDHPANVGHPQMLTEENLNLWLHGEGRVEVINSRGAVGKCYYGVFKGNL